MMCYALRMNENRLSDMVWALCQADRGFLVFFFEYIFDIQNEEIDVYFLEREAIQVGGRNDFLFYTSKGYYILESKINDKTINACNYLGYVNNEQGRIRYILASDNEGRYGSDWIVDKERHLLGIDYCRELGSRCCILTPVLPDAGTRRSSAATTCSIRCCITRTPGRPPSWTEEWAWASPTDA